MPDLFRGDPVPVDRPADYDLAGWQARNQPADIDPVIALTLADIAANTNIQRIGVVGYCFGGKYVARWLGRGEAAILAGYTAHPANVAAAEWAGVAAPLSIANAGEFSVPHSAFQVRLPTRRCNSTNTPPPELDTTFPLAEARLAEDILRNASVAWQLDTYSDVPHGFGIRANESLPRQVFAKEQAFVQAVTWFDTFVRPENVTFGVAQTRRASAPYERTFAEEHEAVVAAV